MNSVVYKFKSKTLSKLTFALLAGMSAFSLHAQSPLSLEQAVQRAQQNDPWLHGSRLKQTAIEHKSKAAATLADPIVSISMVNLPTDSWSLEQEGMTQLKVGIAQMLPRGDSLAIKGSQLQIEAAKYPLLREERKAKVRVIVSELWLEAFLAQQTIRLIESDRALFEQMAEVARANYSNAVGKTRQQDVIRAQLEIIQLEDRLTAQQQKLESTLARLHEWLQLYDEQDMARTVEFDSLPTAFGDGEYRPFRLSNTLPKLYLAEPTILKASTYSRNQLASALASHPAILAIEIKRKISEKSIDLAKQQYKPQWSLNASYGYRDDMPSGDSRADLFSVGVSFDLPLFTAIRQDKRVAASIAETEAVKTEKLLLIKQMMSAVESEVRQLRRLSDRQTIYKQQLLTQTHEQAEASLTAYTNDDGDFAEVVRARIAELNAQVSALKIDVDGLKAVVRLNYYFTASSNNLSGQSQDSSANSHTNSRANASPGPQFGDK